MKFYPIFGIKDRPGTKIFKKTVKNVSATELCRYQKFTRKTG